MTTAGGSQQTALGRFAALVLADEKLQHDLGEIDDAGRFGELVIAAAATHGIDLDAEALKAALRPDPLGLSRWSMDAVTGAAWPPPGWLPNSNRPPRQPVRRRLGLFRRRPFAGAVLRR